MEEDKLYVHVRNLEKYHPNYKDRQLHWAKIHFSMVRGDPNCELITDEIDWARLIKFIILELQAKEPIPLDSVYLTKQGFDLKKRPISLTLKMLHNFLDTVTQLSKVCALEESRVEESRVDKNPVTDSFTSWEVGVVSQWTSLCDSFGGIKKIKEMSGKRREKLRGRYRAESFRDFEAIVDAIKQQPFLYGDNERKWVMTFDWLIENDTNYLKVLELRYRKESATTAPALA